MKKKSTSQSVRRSLGEGGFFNLRFLIGLFVFPASVFLALFATANPSGLGFGMSANASAQGEVGASGIPRAVGQRQAAAPTSPRTTSAQAKGSSGSQTRMGQRQAAVRTSTPTTPGCGLMVGSGLTIGFGPNDFGYLATNIVNYTFGNSQSAPNDFALFQTHDPWDNTVIKDAITGAGHTYSVFFPGQLPGFNFNDYRVIILNWDDHNFVDFNTPYAASIPALEDYVNAGGVVWVQAGYQGNFSFVMPFGGVENYDLSSSDFIVDTASPMVAGAPNPITGNFASHGSYVFLPAGAHVVATKMNASGPPVLYDLRSGQACGPTPTPTPTVPPTPTPCGQPSQWVLRAPLPYLSFGVFVVSDGTFVYAGGGNDNAGTVHSDLLRFDPVANSWTSLASSPDTHFLSPAVYDNGKIYNMGGADANFQLTDTTRIYTIATNSWTTGAPMPVGLADHAAAIWNGIIYIAGGVSSSGSVDTLYAYDIAANSWSTLASMPQALFLPGFGVIDDKLYLAGGGAGGTELNTLYIYDIASNSWSTGATVPTPVVGPGSTVFNGKLYLFGGGAPFPAPTFVTQIYDPVSDIWSSGPNLIVNRLWFYGTAVGDSIVAPGGADSRLFALDVNEQATASPCTPTPRPTPTPRSQPTPRPRP